MRVLQVIPSIGPERGGPSLAVQELASGLAALGVEVQIATTNDNGDGFLDVPLNTAVIDDGFLVWYFRRQARAYTFSWPLTLWLARHIADFDVVHIHALFSYATAPAAFLSARARVPYVVRPLGTLNRWGMTHRRPYLKKFSYRLVERRVLRGSSAIHYTSEQERSEARELGVTGHDIVIPLGIDLTRFTNLPARSEFLALHPMFKDRTIILYLSRISEKKGLSLLLPAFQRLVGDNPDLALVIAGSGDPELVRRLHAQAEQLGIEERVAWLGHLTGDSKMAAFGAADIFVLPSYSENFGIALVEAMAAGLPVLTTDQVAVAPQIVRSQAGLVVPCDLDELSGALRALVANPELRSNLGHNAQHLARRLYSKETMARGVLDLYQQLAPAARR